MILASAIVAFVAVTVTSDINTEIQADPDLNADAKATMQTIDDNLPSTLDYGFLFMLVLLWIFLIVSTLFIDSHPIFFVIMFVLMIFAFVVVFVLGNSFYEIANDAQFSAFQSDLPIIYFITTHLLETIIVIGSTTLISLYAKQRYSQ